MKIDRTDNYHYLRINMYSQNRRFQQSVTKFPSSSFSRALPARKTYATASRNNRAGTRQITDTPRRTRGLPRGRLTLCTPDYFSILPPANCFCWELGNFQQFLLFSTKNVECKGLTIKYVSNNGRNVSEENTGENGGYEE